MLALLTTGLLFSFEFLAGELDDTRPQERVAPESNNNNVAYLV